jgi:hypothetical protein
MYLYLLFLTLYMFRGHRAHHQERQIVPIPLVTVTLCRWPCRLQVESDAQSTKCKILLKSINLECGCNFRAEG